MITVKLLNGKPVFPDKAKPEKAVAPVRLQPRTSQADVRVQSSHFWNEYNQVRIEQSKEANKIHELLDRGATKNDIAKLYDSVESFRDQLIDLYERARQSEKGEPSPVVKADPVNVVDTNLLRLQKTRLSDKRSKLKDKIEKGIATGSKNVDRWRTELQLANLEYDDLVKQIKG